MYESYYGLTEKPFNLTPDSHFLFLSAKHTKALGFLRFGIKEKKGFILITGEVGAGKTTLCRAVLNELGPETEVAVVLNTNVSEEELIRAINRDLGLEVEGKSRDGLIQDLNYFLLGQQEAQKNVVVIIDEAQNLEFPALEQLRMLSNLETEKDKLLQIVLVGQPELRARLTRPELKQLNQRVSVRYHIGPMTRRETAEYIRHRLSIAGNDGSLSFTRSGIDLVYAFSGGVPRMVNVACDRTLLAGYVAETKTLSRGLVRRAIREVEGREEWFREHPEFFSAGVSLRRVATAIAVPLAVFFWFQQTGFRGQFGQLPRSSLTMSLQPLAKGIVPQPLDSAENVPAPEMLPKNVEAAPAAGTFKAACIHLASLWGIDPEVTTLVLGSGEAMPRQFASRIQQNLGMLCIETWADIAFLEQVGLPSIVQLEDGSSWVWQSRGADGTDVLASAQTTMKLARGKLGELCRESSLVLCAGPMWRGDPLFVGASGRRVRQLQTLLARAGYAKVWRRGQFDRPTAEAIIEVERDFGLPKDGIAGAELWLILVSRTLEGSFPVLKAREADAR